MPSHMDHFIEDRNYYNDRRVRAAEEDDGLVRDERAMTLTWVREGETESGEVEEVNIPGRFEAEDDRAEFDAVSRAERAMGA